MLIRALFGRTDKDSRGTGGVGSGGVWAWHVGSGVTVRTPEVCDKPLDQRVLRAEGLLGGVGFFA